MILPVGGAYCEYCKENWLFHNDTTALYLTPSDTLLILILIGRSRVDMQYLAIADLVIMRHRTWLWFIWLWFLYHIMAWTKWPPFADNLFKSIFLNENNCILIPISLKFAPKGPIGDMLALFRVIVWCWIDDRPLPDPNDDPDPWFHNASLFSTKLLPEPIMTYCELQLKDQNSVKL